MENKQLKELNILSGIAIIFVVLVHCNGFYLTHILQGDYIAYFNAPFFIRLLYTNIRHAVPIFIFIAGYKYARNNINETYISFFFKKVKRVLKPFLIISIIFILYESILKGNYSITYFLEKFLYIFIGKNKAYQLWYIPMYLFISFTYPLLYKLLPNNIIRITFIGIHVIGQRIIGYLYPELSDYPITFIYYFTFYEMGVLFFKYNIKTHLLKCDTPIIILYFIHTIILTINPFPSYEEIYQLFVFAPFTVIALYLLSIKLKNAKPLLFLGKYSFYIFLFHEPVICKCLCKFFYHMNWFHSVFDMLIIGTLTILLTLLTYFIIDKSFLKHIFFSPS